MNKYLIQWNSYAPRVDDYSPNINVSNVKVSNLTDKELEEFCSDKRDIKVTFLCPIEEYED